MAHSHEEFPRDLVKDFSQTRNQPEEESPVFHVSIQDRNTNAQGSAGIPDSLSVSTVHSQEESTGVLSQDFGQKESLAGVVSNHSRLIAGSSHT